MLCASCTGTGKKNNRSVGIIVLDPGHFHASLVLKNQLEGVSETVGIFAPEGTEVRRFLSDVEGYNSRQEAPTAWKIKVYAGDNYLERMLADPAGDVVVLSGNNRKKTEYILESVKSGRNVLSDKPMAINSKDFGMLAAAFQIAADNGLVVYDMMTERYDMLNMVARRLINDKALFGDMLPGSASEPSISMRSVHNFFKTVSGMPLIRPAWYYDVEQQGEGIADVTTHLIDLAAWFAFPCKAVPTSDIEVIDANHWPTRVSQQDYARSTGVEQFPPFLEKYVKDRVLEVMANGSLVYSMKGVHVGIEVLWNYSSPDGADRFSAVINGEKARLEIVQDATTGFVKQLYLRMALGADPAGFEKQLATSLKKLRKSYPFLSVTEKSTDLWLVEIPITQRTGHETHFGLVAAAFLKYLRDDGNIPEWETENTLSKYYITTTAVVIANSK